MPFWTSLAGDEGGPHGETAAASPTEELRDCLEYYHDIADDPGEVLVPALTADDHPGYRDAAEEFGVTWLLWTADPADADEVRAGPPE